MHVCLSHFGTYYSANVTMADYRTAPTCHSLLPPPSATGFAASSRRRWEVEFPDRGFSQVICFGQWSVSWCDTITSLKEAYKIRLTHSALQLLAWDRHTCFTCWARKRMKDIQSRAKGLRVPRQGQSMSANSPANLGREWVHLRSARPHTHNWKVTVINCYFKHWVSEVTHIAMANWNSDDMTSQINISSCRN